MALATPPDFIIVRRCRQRGSAVARYTETLTIDKPFATAWDDCRRALTLNPWTLSATQNNTFFIRERLGLIDLFFRNPCRFAVNLERAGEMRTTIHLSGATLGFGPLPKNRLRRSTAILKAQLLGELEKTS